MTPPRAGAWPSSALVVGGGIAGLSTAYHLARSGARVTLIERRPGLGRGSSALSAGILRTMLGHPGTDALAVRGSQLLRQPPPDLSDRSFVDPVGLLLVADDATAARQLDRDVTAFAEQHPEVPIEALTQEAAQTLCPRMAQSPRVAYRFPDHGHLRVTELLDALEAACKRLGVQIRCDTRVAELLARNSQVTGVRLAGGEELRADRVCLATGGLAGELAARCGSPLRFAPTRRHLVVAPGLPPARDQSSILWSLSLIHI